MLLLNFAFWSSLPPCTVTTCSCPKCPLFSPLIRLVVSVHLCLLCAVPRRTGNHEKFCSFTCFPTSWTYSVVQGRWSDPAPLLHKYCGRFAEMHFEYSLMYKKDDVFPLRFCFLQIPPLHTPFGSFFQLCSFAWKIFATELLICLYFLLSICI